VIEDYECEVTAPRTPVRAGRDVQPFGLGDILAGVVWGGVLWGPLVLWLMGVV